MDDEPQIGLVEPHAQRRRGDQRLDAVGQKVRLELLPLGRVGLTGVRGDGVAVVRQQCREIACGRHRQRVHDARTRKLVQMLGQPGRATSGFVDADHRQVQ